MENTATKKFTPSFDWQISEDDSTSNNTQSSNSAQDAHAMRQQKDATRYHWLRDNCCLVPSAFGLGQVALGMGRLTEIEKQKLDAHIDAAWVKYLTETQDASDWKLPLAAPSFNQVAKQKLDSLLADGFQITGYSVEKQAGVCEPPIRGFCTAGGFVGWWHRNPNPGTGQIWPVASEGDNAGDKPPAYSVGNSFEDYFSASTEPTAELAAIKHLQANPDLDHVFVGENFYPTAHTFVDGSGILEDADVNAYHNIGEESYDWLSKLIPNEEKCAELEKLVGDWIQSQEPPSFFEVKNIKKFTRTELLESGHLKNEQKSQ